MRLVNSVTKVAMKYERFHGADLQMSHERVASALKFLKCIYVEKSCVSVEYVYEIAIQCPSFENTCILDINGRVKYK